MESTAFSISNQAPDARTGGPGPTDLPLADDRPVDEGSDTARPDTPALAANDRRHLARAIGHAMVAFAAFFIGCGLWNVVIDRLHARPSVPQPFQTKLSALTQPSGGRPYDTVFIGSSRVFHGLDPATFDAEMTRRGIATRTFNLGIDALNFAELQFVVDRVLSEPRLKLKLLVVEASLRARLAPGLESSQRALELHDLDGSARLAALIFRGNLDWRRKAFWSYQHARVTMTRLSNVGALTDHYIRPAEPPAQPAELLGETGNGFSGLEAQPGKGLAVSGEDIAKVVSDQRAAEAAGTQRTLNDYEVSLLNDLNDRVAGAGATLLLVLPPTADPDIFGEFAAVSAASRSGRLRAATVNFADPASEPRLYEPAGFYDPDHILSGQARRMTTQTADAAARVLESSQPAGAAREDR